MPRKFILSYFLIIIIIIVSMSLSKYTTEKIRSSSVSFMAPLWEKLVLIKQFIAHPTTIPSLTSLSHDEEVQLLQLENLRLQQQLLQLHRDFSYRESLQSKLDTLATLNNEKYQKLSNEYQQTSKRLGKNLQWEINALPARVLFRSLDTWNSSLWINVGQADNDALGSPVVEKNSPVILGQAVVGIIDYVGKHQSKVRLITDSQLNPSVRVMRGGEQDLLAAEKIEDILRSISRKKPAKGFSTNEQENLTLLLKKLKSSLQPFKKSWYLAKGELQGTKQPLGRRHSIIMKGTGFNYDFEDEEGDGRDLRTGKPLHHPNDPEVPILKLHDILVTTGMDGVFPPGLRVATITKIQLLKEGDFYYEIEAKPIIEDLQELSLVFVLPSQGEYSEPRDLHP